MHSASSACCATCISKHMNSNVKTHRENFSRISTTSFPATTPSSSSVPCLATTVTTESPSVDFFPSAAGSAVASLSLSVLRRVTVTTYRRLYASFVVSSATITACVTTDSNASVKVASGHPPIISSSQTVFTATGEERERMKEECPGARSRSRSTPSIGEMEALSSPRCVYTTTPGRGFWSSTSRVDVQKKERGFIYGCAKETQQKQKQIMSCSVSFLLSMWSTFLQTFQLMQMKKKKQGHISRRVHSSCSSPRIRTTTTIKMRQLVPAVVFLMLLVCSEGALGFQAMLELPGGGKQCLGEQLSKHVLVVGEVHLLHPIPPAAAGGRKAAAPVLVTALDSSSQTPIYKQHGKEHVRTAFTTTRAGTHSFCVQNTGAERIVVDVQMLWGPEARDYGQIAKAEHLDEVMLQLMRLQDRLKLYQANVLYMRQNEQKMREDSDATASWLMIFCIINVLLLILTALASAYYFKRFFRSKKII